MKKRDIEATREDKKDMRRSGDQNKDRKREKERRTENLIFDCEPAHGHCVRPELSTDTLRSIISNGYSLIRGCEGA